MNDRSTRRRVLGLCGAGIATGLAGCSGGDDGGTGTEGPGDTGTDAGDTDGTGPGGGAIQTEDSYVMEIDLHEAGTPDIRQTLHGGDSYTRTELGNGEVFESYHVDGETYSIVSGNCTIESDPPAENSIPDIQHPSGIQGELSPSETTTIDGESVEVYDHPDEDARWYVSTETGYPVQFEMDVATVTFHSWGDTDPITAPDVECIEL